MILRCREEFILQLQDQIQLFEDDGAQLRDQVRRDGSQNETPGDVNASKECWFFSVNLITDFVFLRWDKTSCGMKMKSWD